MMAPLRQWLAAPLSPEVSAAVDRLRRAPDVAGVALMPDVHLAEQVCVGTVLATHSRIYPAAVGGDIGCGVAALRFDGLAERLEDARISRRILDLLARLIPPMARSSRALLPLPDAVAALPLSETLRRRAEREAPRQLGTLGRGNHFLELQADDSGELWVMVHSGSRGMGPAIRDHHVGRAQAAEGRQGPGGLASLRVDSQEGGDYLRDMAWALAWAEANRLLLLDAVAVVLGELLGVEPVADSLIQCHHNHVRSECWQGQTLWIHRKGAIPASDGEAGIIPGSMGSASYHTLGRGEPGAFGSSSHGAGRAMSRTEASARFNAADLRRQMGRVCFATEHAGALVEEAPAAYRDIGAVMAAQRALTRVVRRLRPLLSYKGG